VAHNGTTESTTTDPHSPTPGTPSASTEAKSDIIGEIDNPGTLVLVYIAIILLVAATVGLSSLGLGRYGLVVQLGIATIQAGLVAYHFMHLRHGDKVVILTALASIFWMGILFVLFMSDYMTRHIVIGF
jgi:cytochrome c oxidase subunit 4